MEGAIGYVLGVMPVAVWMGVALVLHGRWREPGVSLRESMLAGVVFCGGWLVLGTELLSLVRGINFWSVVFWWGVPLVGVWGWVVWEWKRIWERGPRVKLRWWRWCVVGIFVLVMGFICGWAFLQAVYSPPNNGDSMSYHLPREVIWMQQGSVEPYATHVPRQIAMPPLTEFAGLTLMVLTGGDIEHNLVQWTAYVLTMVAASVMTKRYGGTYLAQWIAALAVATFPMAFLQASNTKNDVAVALFATTLLYFVLRLADGWSWMRVGIVGLCLGELMLTKGTGMIFAVPVAVVGIALLMGHAWKRSLVGLAVIGGIALLVNSGAWWRNYEVFGSIAPNTPLIHQGDTVVNQTHAWVSMESNAIRNIAPHLVVPESWSEEWNEKLTRWVLAWHHERGLNPSDPKTTFFTGPFRRYTFEDQNKENQAAAPMHMALLILTLVILPVFWIWGKVPRGAVAVLLFILVADFVLFCVLLKWQYWNPRLIVAWVGLIAPVFGWAWTAPRVKWMWWVFAGALCVGLWPSMDISTRPMWGPNSVLKHTREQRRYVYNSPRGAASPGLADWVAGKKPGIVGLNTPIYANWDYMIMRRLLDDMKGDGKGGPRFVSFNAEVQVPGKAEPDPDVAILCPDDAEMAVHEGTGTTYVRVRAYGGFGVYVREK